MKDLDWLNFNWGDASLSGRKFEKTDMSLQVKLNYPLVTSLMQLDLGLAQTTFYYSQISNHFNENALRLVTREEMINGQKTAYIQDEIKIEINNLIFSKMKFILLYDRRTNSHQVEHNSKLQPIGSLGMDFCTDKILIIDYPKCRLAVLDSLPKAFQNFNFQKIRLEKHCILLPFVINEKEEHLIFDTGSSLFSLLLDRAGWNKLKGTEKPKKFKISAWGKNYTAYESSLSAKVSFADTRLAMQPVYYCSYVNKSSDFLRSIGALGFVGNRYFLDKLIVLDFQGLRVAISNSY
jgi:hypothetical protein